MGPYLAHGSERAAHLGWYLTFNFDFDAEWSNVVSSVDASEWGLGACEAAVDIAKVKEAGKYSERWRFMHPEFAKPRQAAAAAAAAAEEVPPSP